jgi:hypothetical protein
MIQTTPRGVFPQPEKPSILLGFSARLNSLLKDVSDALKERPVAKATLNRGPLFGRLKPPAPSGLRKTELFSKL